MLVAVEHPPVGRSEAGGLAATVEVSRPTVLHVDEDFELIAGITGQPVERFVLWSLSTGRDPRRHQREWIRS